MWNLKAHTSPVTSMTFNHDGSELASAELAGTVLIWDLIGAPTNRVFEVPSKPADQSARSLVYLPESRGLVMGYRIGPSETDSWCVHIMSLDGTESHILTRSHHYEPIAVVHSNRSELLTLNATKRYSLPQLLRWRIADWSELIRSPGGYFSGNPLLTVNLNLVCSAGSESPNAFTIDLSRGRYRKRQVHPSDVRGLALRPGLNQLATAGPCEVKIWNMPRFSLFQNIPRIGSQYITTLAFSPDGDTLAVGRNAGLVNLYDTDTWQQRATFTWPVGNVRHLAFAPDSLRLAVAGERGSIVIWDLE